MFRYFPGGAQVPESVAVNVRNRSHALIVDVTVTDAAPATASCWPSARRSAAGRCTSSTARIRYVHNLYGKERHMIESPEPLAPGEHRIEYVFTKDDGLGGVGVLRCDGRDVARDTIPRFTPSGFNGVGVGVTCGYEWGPAVGTGYAAPFPFAGTIRRASVRDQGAGRP